MPYKNSICGIYCITTPAGSQYVGSSHCVKSRWAGHRSRLRAGRHHSTRLQAAWDKYGENLAFSIIELCDRVLLNDREQYWIGRFAAELNTTQFVKNLWQDAEYREKMRRAHSTEAWKSLRSEITTRMVEGKRISVDCSNGSRYPSMTKAAKEFGIRTSGIKHLVKTQRAGKHGVRFKLSSEEWTDTCTAAEARRASIRKSGRGIRTEEMRAKMRLNRAGWKFPPEAQARSKELSSRPVIGTSISGGSVVTFPSQRDAARAVSSGRHQTGSSQICKAIKGVKKSAYGYVWSFA